MRSLTEIAGRLKGDLRWGVSWGVAFGIGFTALAALGLTLGAGAELDLSLPRLAASYLAGSVAVGIIAGSCRPLLARGGSGPYLVGVMSGVPIWFALSFGFGFSPSLAGGRVLLFLFICMGVGGVGALALWNVMR
jgi:hypothetical protein